MELTKLKKIHIIIIGVVMSILIGVGMFFLLIKPRVEELEKQTERRDKAAVLGNNITLNKTNDNLIKKNLELESTQNRYDRIMKRCMPNLDFSDRVIGMFALWKEQGQTLGNLLKYYAHDDKVQMAGLKFNIPAPPVTPNDPIFTQEVLVYKLDTISVRGDFRSLMDNITRWNNAPRLVMVDSVKLEGSSPSLVSSYTLTCFVFPRAVASSELFPMADAGSNNQQGSGMSVNNNSVSPAQNTGGSP